MSEKILSVVIIIGVTVFLYCCVDIAGDIERGYEAVGAELLVPALVIILFILPEDKKESEKNGKQKKSY